MLPFYVLIAQQNTGTNNLPSRENYRSIQSLRWRLWRQRNDLLFYKLYRRKTYITIFIVLKTKTISSIMIKPCFDVKSTIAL